MKEVRNRVNTDKLEQDLETDDRKPFHFVK